MQKIVLLGLILAFLGVLLVFVGLSASPQKGEGTIKGGAVIFIGPIPIVLGTDRDSAILVAILALALMAAAYILFRR